MTFRGLRQFALRNHLLPFLVAIFALIDPASRISFGTGLRVAGLATDNAGNVYVSDSVSKKLLRFAASALTQGYKKLRVMLEEMENIVKSSAAATAASG